MSVDCCRQDDQPLPLVVLMLPLCREDAMAEALLPVVVVVA